jgi:hypothetical protein
MSDFWTNLTSTISKLSPTALGQVGGFFSSGSNTEVMQLLQQLHDDPSSASTVKTALIAAKAPDTVLNWVDAAAQAAANKDANGFANAIANAKDAELKSNGTIGSISNVIGPLTGGGVGQNWRGHPFFRR